MTDNIVPFPEPLQRESTEPSAAAGPAEVIPFVPRPSERDALVSLLERYVDLARTGEITGVIIAAKPQADVISGDIPADYVGVNVRERTVLIEELREISSYDYDV